MGLEQRDGKQTGMGWDATGWEQRDGNQIRMGRDGIGAKGQQTDGDGIG